MSPSRSGAVTRTVPASAAVFAALGDDRRLRLVARLSDGGPMSITGLTAGTGVSRQAVTKHLHVLAAAGLVRGARQGRERRWRLRTERLAEARGWLDHLSRRWDATLDRLKTFVEETD